MTMTTLATLATMLPHGISTSHYCQLKTILVRALFYSMAFEHKAKEEWKKME